MEHCACNLIVLEHDGVVTSQRRTEKAHASNHEQYFSPKKVSVFTTAASVPLYLKLLWMETLFCPSEGSFMKSQPQSAENEDSLETEGLLC